MIIEPVFDIGSMTGLMTLFGRHSGIMTNFSIFMTESRPYWSQGDREEPGVRRAQPGPGVPGGRVIAGIWHWLGPGNTNARVYGWVLPSTPTPGIPLPVPTWSRTRHGRRHGARYRQYGDR